MARHLVAIKIHVKQKNSNHGKEKKKTLKLMFHFHLLIRCQQKFKEVESSENYLNKSKILDQAHLST